MQPSLRHWQVISLRPLGQHRPVQRAVAAGGGRCVALSVLQLQAWPADSSLQQALAAPIRIFTSPAAVRFAALSATLIDNDQQITLAVGSGTAAALQATGVKHIQTPVQAMRSEGLLALQALQSNNAKPVGLITAPDGRSLLTDNLLQRGFTVIASYVYRRKVLRLGQKNLRQLSLIQSPFALLVTSLDAFTALWQQLPVRARQRLREGVVVAASARIAEHLRGCGIRQIRQADNALIIRLLRMI